MSLSQRIYEAVVSACVLGAVASTTVCLAASPNEAASPPASASPLPLPLPLPSASTPSAAAQTATSPLLATYQRMSDKLAHNAFGRPMQLDSAETPDGLKGDVYAVVDHPIADVSTTLKSASHWCELLLLHINNRRCKTTGETAGAETLTLSVVRSYDQAPESAFELPFAYRVTHSEPDHLEVDMSAPSGPLGTGNYRVALEAVAIDERKTFVHFSYSYDHNMMARLATQAYLATFGSNKVGFTVVGKGAGGEPEYIRGTRGLVERNAMRYFLTLDAYLAERSAPAGQQFERRLRHWFNGAERYAPQLHEVDIETYLALKRDDRERTKSRQQGTGDR